MQPAQKLPRFVNTEVDYERNAQKSGVWGRDVKRKSMKKRGLGTSIFVVGSLPVLYRLSRMDISAPMSLLACIAGCPFVLLALLCSTSTDQ
jgi:hypothetical protein